MFSGIIEAQGELIKKEFFGSNLRLHIGCPFLNELKIDQSVSHNGVCLTVNDLDNSGYFVDVISESLDKSNLGKLKAGDKINLERSMRLNDRLDGHIVQGHVDQTAVVRFIKDLNGSWTYTFAFRQNQQHTLIEKGSICVNGVSLTISDLSEKKFSVSVIPYTFQHTNFHLLKVDDEVNIEFDVIGKYVEKLLKV